MNQAATESVRKAKRCHGLAPWRFTLAAMGKAAESSEMPRPCAVESHVCCCHKAAESYGDATAQGRGIQDRP